MNCMCEQCSPERRARTAWDKVGNAFGIMLGMFTLTVLFLLLGIVFLGLVWLAKLLIVGIAGA